LAKGHIGGIVARLLSTPGIRVVGARMYEPSVQMRDELTKATEDMTMEDGEVVQYEESVVDFVSNGLTEEHCAQMGINNRVLLLLFAGTDTRKKLARVVGDDFPQPEEYGRTIRGTYGEYTRLLTGEALNFEPSVIIPHTPKSNRAKLAIFAKYAEPDGGIMVRDCPPESSPFLLDITFSLTHTHLIPFSSLPPSLHCRGKRFRLTRACHWRQGW